VVERPNPRRQENPLRIARPVPLEDAELIEEVKAGQTEAFGQLVEKYQDRVFNACWRICGHLEDARDATQETFLKAFNNISTFRQHSGFYTWIFRIAVNQALSNRRQAARRRTISLDQTADPAGTQAEDLARRVRCESANDPAEPAIKAELRSRVSQALLDLDADQRAVVVLRDIEGLDYHEIGEILEVPPGTVKSRLHRARMAIREAVMPVLKEELE
jgi:RNA polymerase sigma-70 factor (ECF subfamily)